jgi:hypothetical protein
MAKREGADCGFWSYLLPAADRVPAGWSEAELPWLAEAQRRHGPIALPTLKTQRPRATKRGRPLLSDSEPLASRYAAWLSSMYGADWSEIANALDLAQEPRERSAPIHEGKEERSLRRLVTRRIKRGQEQLRAEGVIPWVAWPAGNLPPFWFLERPAIDALDRWFAIAHEMKVEMAQVLDAAREQARLVRAHPWLLPAVSTGGVRPLGGPRGESRWHTSPSRPV